MNNAGLIKRGGMMKNLLVLICVSLTLLCSAARVVEEVYLTAADGSKLYTLVAFPQKGKKYPVIVHRTPYAKNTPEAVAGSISSMKKRNLPGFIQIVQHCRGTGMSGGDFIPYINEQADGLKLLKWIREQEFYNGEIYLSGGSYGASVHGSYLNTRQPDIKGVYWSVQDTERYNIIYRNGFMRMRLHASWYLGVYKRNTAIKRDRKAAKFSDFPLSGITQNIFGEPAEDFEAALLHPDKNDSFWKTPGAGGGEYSDAVVNAGVPTFFVGAWHDLYITGMIDIWRKLDPEHRKNCVMVITPFDHANSRRGRNIAPELFSPGGQLNEFAKGYGDLSIRWFEHLHKGTALKHFAKGKVTRYVLFGDRWAVSDDIGTNSIYRKYYLNSDRTLTTSPGAENRIIYTYDPRNPATFKGACHGNFGGVALQDPPNSRQDIISFISKPFEQDKIIEGGFKGKLFVTSSAPDTCFYLRLSVVKGDRAFGLRNEIDSICRTNPEFVPGKEAVIDFKIAPHHFKVEKGDRLRLDVSSSCWPYFQLHSNFRGIQALQKTTQSAKNTIITGKSFIEIPFSGTK